MDGGALAQDVTNPATFGAETTIVDFFAGVADPTKAADETNTYAFAGWATAADATAIDETSTALMSTLLATDADAITLYALYTATPIASEKTYILGDIDGSGTVENADIVEFVVYGKTGTSAYAIGQKLGNTEFVLGDIDGNGTVENADIVEFVVYGKTGTSNYTIGQPLN